MLSLVARNSKLNPNAFLLFNVLILMHVAACSMHLLDVMLPEVLNLASMLTKTQSAYYIKETTLGGLFPAKVAVVTC